MLGEGGKGEGEEIDIFKRSNIMERSPLGRSSKGEDMRALFKEWREESGGKR